MKAICEIIKELERKLGTAEPEELADRLGLIIRYQKFPKDICAMYTEINDRCYIIISTNTRLRYVPYAIACGIACFKNEQIEHLLFSKGQSDYYPVHECAVALLTYRKEIDEDETIFDYLDRMDIPHFVINSYLYSFT